MNILPVAINVVEKISQFIMVDKSQAATMALSTVPQTL